MFATIWNRKRTSCGIGSRTSRSGWEAAAELALAAEGFEHGECPETVSRMKAIGAAFKGEVPWSGSASRA